MTYDLAPEQPRERPPPHRPVLEITDDLACLQCGYNLRGLTRKHRCPECGKPAMLSVAGNSLQSAPARWLRTVATGLLMLLWSFAIQPLGVVVSVVFLRRIIHIAMPFFGLLSAVLAVAGLICITTAEPKSGGSDPSRNLRTGLRYTAVLQCACTLILLARIPSVPGAIVTAAGVIWELAFIAILLGLSLYLRRFATRMDCPELEHKTTNVIWGLVVSLGAIVLFAPLTVLTRNAGPPGCVVMVAMMSALAFAIWFLFLLARYYTAFKWAAHFSPLDGDVPSTREME